MICVLWRKHNVVLAQAFWTIYQVNQQYVAHSCSPHHEQGFFQLFAQGGGEAKWGQVRIRVQSMWQTRGSRGMLRGKKVEKIFIFTIWHENACYISEVSGLVHKYINQMIIWPALAPSLTTSAPSLDCALTPGILILDLLLDAIWWNLVLFCTNIGYHLLCHRSFYKGLNWVK